MEYVKQTGVDALAVAIGTAHGVYKGTPQIHFDLLHELKDALDIPLVLHGGSGTGDEIWHAVQERESIKSICPMIETQRN